MYIKRLDAVDEGALKRLIRAAWHRSREVELAFTHRDEHARAIAEAKAPEAKKRRVDATMAKLRRQ